MNHLLIRAEQSAVLAAAVMASALMVIRPTADGLWFPAVVLLALVAWIAVRDITDFIIPDAPLVCIAIIAAGMRLAAAEGMLSSEIWAIVIDATICGGLIWAIREAYYRLRGIDGIGFGDVKLAAAGAILTGAAGFAWALFMASLTGLLFVVAVGFVRPGRRPERLPFGALLAPACWLVWVARQRYGL